eukprot:3180333-Rhodomonas_salina.1
MTDEVSPTRALCPVRSCATVGLRPYCAVSGTDLVYRAQCPVLRYCMAVRRNFRGRSRICSAK